MSPADQGLLEDFDTEQLAKRRKKIYVQRPLAFRSHLSEAAAGAEHGAASSSASVNAKNPPVFRSQRPCAAAAAERRRRKPSSTPRTYDQSGKPVELVEAPTVFQVPCQTRHSVTKEENMLSYASYSYLFLVRLGHLCLDTFGLETSGLETYGLDSEWLGNLGLDAYGLDIYALQFLVLFLVTVWGPRAGII